MDLCRFFCWVRVGEETTEELHPKVAVKTAEPGMERRKRVATCDKRAVGC